MKSKGDYFWRSSRVAAGLLLRYEQGRLSSERIQSLKKLLRRPGVTERLIDQGIAFYEAKSRKRRLVVS